MDEIRRRPRRGHPQALPTAAARRARWALRRPRLSELLHAVPGLLMYSIPLLALLRGGSVDYGGRLGDPPGDPSVAAVVSLFLIGCVFLGMFCVKGRDEA